MTRYLPLVRCATDEDRRLASLDRPIPFDKVDPAALAAACDCYAEQTGDVDEVAFGSALEMYFEAKASA